MAPNLKRAAAPSATAVPYVDNDRDYRDCLLLNAIKAAISLIEDSEAPDLACDVLRLARDRMTDQSENFVAEVSHVQ